MKVLFIAWDGPEQRYLESLFLPIYARLQAHGLEFHVMQFVWGEAGQPGGGAEAGAAETARALGIAYARERIVRQPKLLATFGTVARGALAVRRYAVRHGIDVLMPRSTLPALMTLVARRGLDVRCLFDADGFMPDERVEFAGWSSSGPLYRLLRDVEAQMLRVSDSVVTRTSKAKSILLARAGAGMAASKIHVIPNAKDPAEFHPYDQASRGALRSELGIGPDGPLLVYAGSLGPQYFPERMLDFVRAVRKRRADAHFLILTGQEAVAQRALAGSGVEPSAVTIRRVAPHEVARHLAAGDLGVALRDATFSQQGVSPIKVAEYLLCGVPVLSSSGIGDLDQQLDAESGRFVHSASAAELDAAADWFLNDVFARRERVRSHCRSRGCELFGLDGAALRYLRALGAEPRLEPLVAWPEAHSTANGSNAAAR